MNTIKLLVIYCLSIFLFISCSEKKITVKGADGTEYESYQECCAAQDFQAAHQFLAKIENTEDSGFDLYDAKEYVFKQEALFLMSQDNDAAKKRILYLLKEEGGNDEHVEMLIDLAIDNDDEDFVKVLAKQHKKLTSEEILRKIVQFLYLEKGDNNLDFVTMLLNEVNRGDLLLEVVAEKGDEKLLLSLAQSYTGELSLSNEKLITILAGTRDKNISEKLIALLDETRIANRPVIGVIKSDHYGDLDSSYDNYISSVKSFNKDCFTLLNIAIKSKNQYLAQRVLPRFKSNIVYTNLGDWEEIVEKSKYCSVYRAYKVTTDNTEINSMKNIYQEAVRSGVFK